MRIRTTLSILALAATAFAGSVEAQAGNTTQAQLEFGVDMAKRGLWKEALFRFRRAQQFDGRNPRILNNVAVAYEAVGEFERALETYREGLAVAPGNAELKRNYSQFLELYQSFQAEQEEAAAAEEDGAAEEPAEEGADEEGSS